MTLPVLMVNGREDFDHPYATTQVPMFKMLGTPEGKKRHLVFEAGHNLMHPQEAQKAEEDGTPAPCFFQIKGRGKRSLNPRGWNWNAFAG